MIIVDTLKIVFIGFFEVFLNLMYNSKYHLNRSLSQISGAALVDLNAYPNYWSSSENEPGYAWICYVVNGLIYRGVKDNNNYVRAVRAF